MKEAEEKVGDPRVVELRRKREDFERKRKEALEQAKLSGEKEELDVEKVVRTRARMSENTLVVDKMIRDQGLINFFEEKYYLDAPSNIRTTDDFLRWIGEQEKAAGSL